MQENGFVWPCSTSHHEVGSDTVPSVLVTIANSNVLPVWLLRE